MNGDETCERMFPGFEAMWGGLNETGNHGEDVPERQLNWRSTLWNIGGVAMSCGRAGSLEEEGERDE